MVNQVKYDRLTGLYSKEFFYQLMKDILMRNPDDRYDVICSDIENLNSSMMYLETLLETSCSAALHICMSRK